MIKKPARNSRKSRRRANQRAHIDEAKPFIEHVNELRVRLMWVVLGLGVASIVGYFIHEQLLAIVRKPLGQTLYYTSPVGGLNFLMKLCLTFGAIVALPIIVYNVLKFFSPLLDRSHKRAIIWYLACSIFLAYGGVVFAYFVSLPAALHFLSSFGGKDIASLITADEYYSFALSYLGGFALLFQLPIIVLFINRIKPLDPGDMMKFQRWVILASFIVAAILTPTPDPINQLIMAAPAILLYQVSIGLVWRANRKRRALKAGIAAEAQPLPVAEVPVTAPAVPRQTFTPAPPPVVGQTSAQPQLISDFQRRLPQREVKRERPSLPVRPPVERLRPSARAMDIFAA